MSVSTLSVNNLYGSLAGFVAFYTVLLVVEMFLMVKFAAKGPAASDRPLCSRCQPEGTPPCLDYVTLKIIWWALVGVLLIGFAIMDGHDMGVGTLLPFVGRTDLERRVAINTVGPHWDGKPGVVHHCRRRTVCGVAGGVCHRVQRGFTGR